jgi:hypothetical protein
MEVSGHLHASGCFTPGKRDPVTRYVGGWMGSRAGLNAVAKRKIHFSCLESNSRNPARSLVIVLTELRMRQVGNLFHNELTVKVKELGNSERQLPQLPTSYWHGTKRADFLTA